MATRYAARLERVIRILVEIKCRLHQTNDELISKLGVSRAQYYEDRKLLDRLGFRFHFERRSRGFVIDQDRYLPGEFNAPFCPQQTGIGRRLLAASFRTPRKRGGACA